MNPASPPSQPVPPPAAELTGAMFIGGRRVTGTGPEVRAHDARTGAPLEPAYPGGTQEDVAAACAAAEDAFDPYRALHPADRARFLETVADNLTALGDTLVARAHQETGLPVARLTGEVARTADQLRMLAHVLTEGSWMGARIDPAQPGRTPQPRPDIRQRQIPLGPVAVFGASNFPLAFSVLGGDTASALAAGCPVVVKAHDAHLGTGELAAQAVRAAVVAHGLPDGVFSLLVGDGPTLGAQLVTDPRIQAVAFTGSRAVGLALARTAAARPRPVPVYAEMSSVNPVVLMPGALAERAAPLAEEFVASLTLGAGQFCTNPGLLLAVDGPGLETFLDVACRAVTADAGATMLTERIARAYRTEADTVASHPGVEVVARGALPDSASPGQATLMTVAAKDVLADPALQREMFGAAALVVRCADLTELTETVRRMEGQLTATLHMAPSDTEDARALLPLLERQAGRVLAGGWPTGVEVGHAMVHGGPYPATTDPRTTSVGSRALERFLRPVAYQNLPHDLLPAALRDDNPYGVPRRVDGDIELPRP
ncbi:aldehyde dehydrogenase (NADP(+)) [Streptomyces sp. NPDC059524]|uniref:aldehyde dehydrogenase (NADP(+)) n=1 Tax=Streptomyces sp. NPDC059524 TaxID=3346856 RepID=UPI0036BD7692